MADVLMYPVPNMRHVPGPSRHAFSETLKNLLAAVAHNPTWEDMYRLLVLPKLVLQASRRRGKAHQQQQAIDVGRRLTMFHECKYEQM